MITTKINTMSKIKFTYNRVYKYVTNTHPVNMFFDALIVGLTGVFLFGFTNLINHIFINGNYPIF